MDTGSAIAKYRRLNKLTTGKLSSMVGVTPSCISKYENGKLSVSTAMLAKIARALDVQIIDLLPLNQRDSDNVSNAASGSRPGAASRRIHFIGPGPGGTRTLDVTNDVCPNHSASAILAPDDSLRERGIYKGDIVLVSGKTKPLPMMLVALVSKESKVSLKILLEYRSARNFIAVTCNGKYQVHRQRRRDKPVTIHPIIGVIRLLSNFGI